MAFNIAHDEIKMLDSDVLEVFEEYGSTELYVMKNNKDVVVDDVYEEISQNSTYTKCKVLGIINNDVKPKFLKEVGREVLINSSSIKILKSTLAKYGYTEITVDDKILYNGCLLDIVSVQPIAVIGDYALLIDVTTKSSELTLKEINYGE